MPETFVYNSVMMELKSLERFNYLQRSANEIARAADVSWPLVTDYLAGGKRQASITHVARVLSGMGVDWRTITLGDLLKVVENGAE